MAWSIGLNPGQSFEEVRDFWVLRLGTCLRGQLGALRLGQ